MRFLEKLKQWLNASNRRTHMWGLGLFFFGLIIECRILGVGIWSATTISYTAVLVAAIAIEAKDKQVGNRPDIFDIVASLILPTLYVIILAVIELIKWLLA